jgi:hypothetical protein
MPDQQRFVLTGKCRQNMLRPYVFISWFTPTMIFKLKFPIIKKLKENERFYTVIISHSVISCNIAIKHCQTSIFKVFLLSSHSKIGITHHIIISPQLYILGFLFLLQKFNG